MVPSASQGRVTVIVLHRCPTPSQPSHPTARQDLSLNWLPELFICHHFPLFLPLISFSLLILSPGLHPPLWLTFNAAFMKSHELSHLRRSCHVTGGAAHTEAEALPVSSVSHSLPVRSSQTPTFVFHRHFPLGSQPWVLVPGLETSSRWIYFFISSLREEVQGN